jgi:hypothetical protein
MLTYQVRRRIFRVAKGKRLPFPSDGKILFYFSPKQPFGVQAGGGRTAVHRAPAKVLFDANTGFHSIESKRPLRPIRAGIKTETGVVSLRGTRLTLWRHFKSNADLVSAIESYYYGFPMLLAVDFADPPIVERVEGNIGGVKFRWELARWRAEFIVTTQQRQRQAFIRCFDSMGDLSKPGRHRILAALHYFHVALRLARRGEIAGEFLPEVLLNFSKALEVLFPATGDGKTRDAVRRGLRTLGITEAEIECDYLPCMALRNEIDAGHASLNIFKVEQLEVVHAYVERSEFAFRRLFQKVLKNLAAGTLVVPYSIATSPSSSTIRVIDRLRQAIQNAESATKDRSIATEKPIGYTLRRHIHRWRSLLRLIRIRTLSR